MKRMYIGLLVVLFMVTFFTSCKKEVKTEPRKEPVKKTEKVEDVTPKVEKPQPTEEEIIQQSTLDELNKQGYLKRINFDFDKSDIRDDMKDILEQNARWLLKHTSVIVTVGGHCDERGTEEYNMALGEKRASAAKKYLVSLGVSSLRLNVVSYGKTQPLVKGSDEESFFVNRRAEFTIVKK
jgi:peptidoglycan-associated lipoprotein